MMNRNELLKLAKECGITFTPAGPGDDGVDAWYGNQYLPNGSLERFAAAMYAAGAADMKERAAEIFDELDRKGNSWNTNVVSSAAIRALPSKVER